MNWRGSGRTSDSLDPKTQFHFGGSGLHYPLSKGHAPPGCYSSRHSQELATLFSRVGFPKQIMTDQGTVFMGKMLKALAQLVGLQTLHTTVYHPQTNGLVE